MWGNFMDKAKEMAANIDQQINESVGMETTTNTSSTLTMKNDYEDDANNENENAWNDDFEFDDDDDDADAVVKTISPSDSAIMVGATPVKETDEHKPMVETMEPPPQPHASTTPDLKPKESTNHHHHQQQQDENPTEINDAVASVSNMVKTVAPASLSSMLMNPTTVMKTKMTEVAENNHKTTTTTTTTASSFLFSTLSGAVNSALDANDKVWEEEANEHVLEQQQEEEEQEEGEGEQEEMIQDPMVTESATKESISVETTIVTGQEEEQQQEEQEDSIDVQQADPMPSMQASSTKSEPATVTTTTTAAVEDEEPKTTATTTTTITTNNVENDPRYIQLQEELKLRESQLTSKAQQLTQLQSMWETQEQELRNKIQETKEEAKKKIMRAKERCDAAEARLKQSTSQGAEASNKQDQLIAELREEGESLARKQSAMEQAVRAAHGETRELKLNLEQETNAKKEALEKIAELEAELKGTKESLKSAQKGESQAGKLEDDLMSARSDAELKATTILALQQQVKELESEGKELKEEMEKTRKSAAQEAQQERKTLRREHNDVISDLEAKLQTTEREAGVREDALRHEVTELRKRWQDAVRRADALSMDVQSSTAPLLRQLESMERQNRARAATWAELENRLRSELEDTVIQNEKLSKDRSDFKSKYTRLERSANESEGELKQSRRTIEDQTTKISKLESQIETLVAEAETREEEYLKVERLANEGVMRVRSEMTQTVVESEERYRGQIEKMESELRVEAEKRSQLESQVQELLDNAGMFVPTENRETTRKEVTPKKLRKPEGQAEILAGALGFEDTDDESDDDAFGIGMDRGDDDSVIPPKIGGGSFAALEQLSSRLRASQIELEALRNNLRDSEKTRESLVEELAESRHAKEKLPLFESKVKELTKENQEMELELRGLREDIAEVRELYRTQLNVLLEEKASKGAFLNGGSPDTKPTESKSIEHGH